MAPIVRMKLPEKFFCRKCKKEHTVNPDALRSPGKGGAISASKFERHFKKYASGTAEQITTAPPKPKKEKVKVELPELQPEEWRGELVKLDHKKVSPETQEFQKFVETKIVGQPEGIQLFTKLFTKINAGICDPDRPRSVSLLLGPTGTGKTYIVEALAEFYTGDPRKMVKLNCGELSSGAFSQKKLVRHLTEGDDGDSPLNIKTKDGKSMVIILFDEIEKASIRLYKVMMNILDKGSLRGEDDEDIDLTHAVIVMTSNLGASEIMRILAKLKGKISAEGAAKMREAALAAAKERFTPEFFNRMDSVITFRPLLKEHLETIVGLEVAKLEQRMAPLNIRLKCSEKAVSTLVAFNFDFQYGARNLKRSLNELIVDPLANLITSGELPRDSRVLIQAAGNTEVKFQRVV